MKARQIIGVMAILCAVCYLLAGATHFLMPPDQLHFSSGVDSAFFHSINQDAAAFHLHYWAFVLAALLSIGVVSGIQIHEHVSYLLRLGRILAILGLTLIALDFAHMHFQVVSLAKTFTGLSAQMREVILLNGLDRLDPYGIAFNLLGIHLIVLCVTARIAGTWPRWVVYTGILAGFLNQFILVGIVTQQGWMIDIAAGLGCMVLIPILFIGFGIIYLKKDRTKIT